MKDNQVTDVLNSIDAFKAKEDGTYNIRTGTKVEYSDGYQVSFVRPEAFEELKHEDWDAITNNFCLHFDSLAYIGVYCGSAEVSFRSISYTKAEDVMVQYNQESILDWEKKNKYPDLPLRWFIMNNSFDEERVITYEQILKEIH